VLTARAKGLSERAVLWRHVLRNSLIPVITVIGYNFGYSLTGAILAETVFAWPGLGSLFISSIGNRDYPVLAGIFLLAAIAVVVANLITDLLYAAADPRVRVATLANA
jgi:peptide/nickel transport system permease protein